MRILIRMVTEEFEIDEALTITESIKEGVPHAQVREPSGPLDENELIEMFELHSGSAYGDKLFMDCGNFNLGYEVIERADND